MESRSQQGPSASSRKHIRQTGRFSDPIPGPLRQKCQGWTGHLYAGTLQGIPKKQVGGPGFQQQADENASFDLGILMCVFQSGDCFLPA